MQAPVTVLQANTKRDSGKRAQHGNIMAAKVRSSLLRAGTRARMCQGVVGPLADARRAPRVARRGPPKARRPRLGDRRSSAPRTARVLSTERGGRGGRGREQEEEGRTRDAWKRGRAWGRETRRPWRACKQSNNARPLCLSRSRAFSSFLDLSCPLHTSTRCLFSVSLFVCLPVCLSLVLSLLPVMCSLSSSLLSVFLRLPVLFVCLLILPSPPPPFSLSLFLSSGLALDRLPRFLFFPSFLFSFPLPFDLLTCSFLPFPCRLLRTLFVRRLVLVRC